MPPEPLLVSIDLSGIKFRDEELLDHLGRPLRRRAVTRADERCGKADEHIDKEGKLARALELNRRPTKEVHELTRLIHKVCRLIERARAPKLTDDGKRRKPRNLCDARNPGAWSATTAGLMPAIRAIAAATKTTSKCSSAAVATWHRGHREHPLYMCREP